MQINSTLIIGSGALENAWLPVFRGIKEATQLELNNPELANLVMARLIFNVRFFNDARAKCGEGIREHVESSLREAREYLRNFRKCLARELQKSSSAGEVTLRKSQLATVQKYVEGNISIVTTNWDVKAFEPFDKTTVIPIHGAAEIPDSLYLPAETSFDGNSVPEIEKAHAGFHFEATKAIESSSKIVIWGLGINALDAELTVVFSEAFHHKMEKNLSYKVIIVDRDPSLVSQKLQIFGVDRSNIEEVTVYGSVLSKAWNFVRVKWNGIVVKFLD